MGKLETTPTFADALAAQNARPVYSRCTVGNWLQKASPADREAAEAALANPDVMHTTIVAAFAELGVKVGTYSVGRHRRRMCACHG